MARHRPCRRPDLRRPLRLASPLAEQRNPSSNLQQRQLCRPTRQNRPSDSHRPQPGRTFRLETRRRAASPGESARGS